MAEESDFLKEAQNEAAINPQVMRSLRSFHGKKKEKVKQEIPEQDREATISVRSIRKEADKARRRSERETKENAHRTRLQRQKAARHPEVSTVISEKKRLSTVSKIEVTEINPATKLPHKKVVVVPE